MSKIETRQKQEWKKMETRWQDQAKDWHAHGFKMTSIECTKFKELQIHNDCWICTQQSSHAGFFTVDASCHTVAKFQQCLVAFH